MSIYKDLLAILNIKNEMKTTLSDKGIDMSDIKFNQYDETITEKLSSNVNPNTDLSPYIITTYDWGSIPTVIPSEKFAFHFNLYNMFNFNPFLSSNALNTRFLLRCYSLTNVTMVPNSLKSNLDFSWCKYLTSESVNSIINAMSNVTESRSLTFTSQTFAKLTDEQKTLARDKGFSIVIKNSEYDPI